MKRFHYLPIIFVLAWLASPAAISEHPKTPAFPGAEGGGKFTTGGRGGAVYYVDNLNDKGNGSFRKAIEKEGPRTIVFRVSGNIELSKPIHIKNGDLTIAGQTAPGGGICLVNYGIRVDADNVIIRFIRVRPGDKMEKAQDAVTGMWHKNIILDHCSMSWSTDEVASFYNNTDFTMQWCILSESLFKSVHQKGEHGYGAIWGGQNASFHHNLFSDHTSRNPRFCGSRYSGKPETESTDFRNNVIYNWGYNTAYGGEEGYYNLINNYYKPGPASKKDVQSRILDLTQKFYDPKVRPDTMHAGWFYIEGNQVHGDAKTSADNWTFGVQGKGVDEAAKLKSKLGEPVAHTAVYTHPAKEAYKLVLKYAGASLSRDVVDKRILKEAKTGKERYGATYGNGQKGVIDSQTEVGGWPELKPASAPKDSDNDGMPDQWEQANKLNPDDPEDSAGHQLHSGYTNLEVYFNSLVEDCFPKN